jgi:hypothetical protein
LLLTLVFRLVFLDLCVRFFNCTLRLQQRCTSYIDLGGDRFDLLFLAEIAVAGFIVLSLRLLEAGLN